MSFYRENQMTDTPTHRYYVDLTDEQADAVANWWVGRPVGTAYGRACADLALAINNRRPTPPVKGDRVRLMSTPNGAVGTMGEPMGPKVLVDWGDNYVGVHLVNALVWAEA